MANYNQAHICQCLTRLSTLRRKSVFTVTGNQRKTGAQFVNTVLSLACRLVEHGVSNGNIVAICGFNSDWYLEWLLAVAFIGAIVAPLNYRWSFEEAKWAMLSVGPVMLVTDESCNHWHFELHSNEIPSIRWHASISSFHNFVESSNVLSIEMLRKASPLLNYSWAPEGAVIICFTSGTTGRPKGVLINHTALIVQSLAKVAIVGYNEDDVYLHTAPLCHIGGLSSAIAILMVGACHILIPKFDAKLAIDVIEQHSVTSLITVPAMMADLISLTRMEETWKGGQTVKKILNGGGSLSAQLTKEATKIFPRAKLLSAYGMTETCSSLTFMTLCDPTLKTSDETLQTVGKKELNSVNQSQGVCVGKPAPHVELNISKDESSHTGRILTRGPHLMLRYWIQNQVSVSDSVNEAWLDTGDIGSIDDNGNLWLVGRKNGRIKSGGENVYPEEVEAILLQHAGVIAAVIVGIPDARLTEMVVACIKLRESWQWSDKHSVENEINLCDNILQNFCREQNLSGFKVPKKFILWRKPFPITTTGKIRRDEVRREVISHLQCLAGKL